MIPQTGGSDNRRRGGLDAIDFIKSVVDRAGSYSELTSLRLDRKYCSLHCAFWVNLATQVQVVVIAGHLRANVRFILRVACSGNTDADVHKVCRVLAGRVFRDAIFTASDERFPPLMAIRGQNKRRRLICFIQAARLFFFLIKFSLVAEQFVYGTPPFGMVAGSHDKAGKLAALPDSSTRLCFSTQRLAGLNAPGGGAARRLLAFANWIVRGPASASCRAANPNPSHCVMVYCTSFTAFSRSLQTCWP